MADDPLPTRSVFRVPGMDCPTEEQLVRMALSGVPGVRSLDFDLGARQLQAVHTGPPDPLIAALVPLAMGAELTSVERLDPAEVVPAGPAPGSPGSPRRALWWVLGINAAMFLVELVAGILAQSTGLVADSLDMLADASVYAIALLAAGTAASQLRAARLSGWLQLALAALVLVEVVRRAVSGSEPVEGLMIGIGLLALAANLTCVAILSRHRRGGAHMRASWIFTTNDALANIGVIVAGALVAITGSALPDLVIGTAIAVLVASGAWRILRMG
ncbi:MAG: cation transporter [Candidatus Nanopelagicales bacterium]|nr:cation transporter [Candidatus Nanopelagicales bacterium]